jgi:hypothetical protein
MINSLMMNSLMMMMMMMMMMMINTEQFDEYDPQLTV